MAIYSWLGTPIHLEMTEDNAAAYNRVAHVLANTVQTDPTNIEISVNSEDMFAYNKVAEVINLIIELNGGSLPYSEEDIKTPYLEPIQ